VAGFGAVLVEEPLCTLEKSGLPVSLAIGLTSLRIADDGGNATH
jgi:hypothetical protein